MKTSSTQAKGFAVLISKLAISFVDSFITEQSKRITSSILLCRVRTGHGKPGKSWNFIISFSRPGKSWNLVVGHGKSWKMR